MVRKGFWCGISFVAGLLLAAAFSVSLWWIFAISISLLALIGAFAFSKFRRYFIVCGICTVIGLIYSTLYTHFVYDKIIAADNSVITVEGYVSDYNYIGHGQGYLTVKGDVCGHSTKISFLVNDDDYEYYDNVKVTGKVSVLKDTYNFQSQRFYFSQGVFLRGNGAAKAELTGSNSHPLLRGINNYSDRIYNTILEFSGDEEKGFLAAMLCGDKSEMDPSLKNMLYRNGIGHIFAVSGTHLVVFCSILFRLLKKPVKNKKVRSVIILLLVWGFVVFSGMSVSVIRSAVMMSIVFISDLSPRRSDSANSLGIAAIILCAAQPYCVFSASFLLSFTAAFAAGTVAPFFTKRAGLEKAVYPLKLFIYSTTVSLCLAPVSLIMFGGYSIIAPLINVLLIPLCTAALFLCFFVAMSAGVVFLAKPLLIAATWIIKAVIAAVRVFSELSILYITADSFWAAAIITVLSICVLIFACTRKKPLLSAIAVAIGTAACLLCSCINTLLAFGRSEFYIFANKKSCTVVVCESENALIFDIGSSGKYLSAVERVFDKKGIRFVDAVFIEKEPYYTIGRYKNTLYPSAEVFLSATELSVPDKDAYLFDNNSTMELGEVVVSRLENCFEIKYNDNVYRFCSDCFYIDNDRYDTDGVSVAFSSDEKIVRRLDYELTVTDIAW